MRYFIDIFDILDIFLSTINIGRYFFSMDNLSIVIVFNIEIISIYQSPGLLTKNFGIIIKFNLDICNNYTLSTLLFWFIHFLSVYKYKNYLIFLSANMRAPTISQNGLAKIKNIEKINSLFEVKVSRKCTWAKFHIVGKLY